MDLRPNEVEVIEHFRRFGEPGGTGRRGARSAVSCTVRNKRRSNAQSGQYICEIETGGIAGRDQMFVNGVLTILRVRAGTAQSDKDS